MPKMITPKKNTKKSKVQDAHVVFILDRSGSMSSIANDTIGGFNSFIKTQAELPGKTRVSLIQFDNEYQSVYTGLDIADVPEMTSKTFVPRGGTALYDAVGRTINYLLETPKTKEKTIIVILTDGEENSSTHFTHSAVRELMITVQNDHGWEVVFIGANMDAAVVGQSYGLKAANIATFQANSIGAASATMTASASAGILRGAKFKNLGTYGDAQGKMDYSNYDTQSVYTAIQSGQKLELDDEDEATK